MKKYYIYIYTDLVYSLQPLDAPAALGMINTSV